MVISTPNFGAKGRGQTLTPAMIRGVYLIWRSELKRDGFAEIREFDSRGRSDSHASRRAANALITAENPIR